MSDTLGAWRNAPLAYVLTEVRTELLADIKSYQPKIAGRLRDQYPIQRTMHAARIVATGAQMLFEPEQDPAWEFATPDNKMAVIVRSNGVVLHATRYEGSEAFLEKLRHVLTVIAEEVPAVYVNRLGYRYLDFVLPRSEEAPEHYVDRRLDPDLGIAADNGGTMVTSLAVYPMDRGRLTLRYTRGKGHPELPPDLGTLSLEPSQLMKKSPEIGDSTPTAVLDTDRMLTYSPVCPLDPKSVYDDFTLMRNDIRRAFHAAITDHALKIWDPK